MEQQIIYRYGKPTDMDHAPQGTECRVTRDDFFDLHIQTSSKEDQPEWIFIGTFDEESYSWYKQNTSTH